MAGLITILTDSGAFLTDRGGGNVVAVAGVRQSSVGCLMPDTKIPSVWEIDTKLGEIHQIDLHAKSVVAGRTQPWPYRARAIQADSMTGNVYVLKPFGAVPADVSSCVYRATQMMSGLGSVTIHSNAGAETIHFAMDIKVDSSRRRLWIADSGNSRVLAMNLDTNRLEYLYDEDDLSFPVGIAVDPNTGGVYVRSYDRDNQLDKVVFLKDGEVYSVMQTTEDFSWSVQSGVDWLNPTDENIGKIISQKLAIPFQSSGSMSYDHLRDNLWWLAHQTVGTLFLFNARNNMARSLALLSSLKELFAVDADIKTGEAIVVGGTGNSYGAVLGVDKDAFSHRLIRASGSRMTGVAVLQYPSEIVACSWSGISRQGASPAGESSSSQSGAGDVSSSSSYSSESSSSSSQMARDLTSIDVSLIFSSEKNEDAVVPQRVETMSHLVDTYIWASDRAGIRDLKRGSVPGMPDEQFMFVDQAVQLPKFSWSSKQYDREPMFVAVTDAGLAQLVEIDTSTASLKVLGSRQSEIGDNVAGLSVPKDNSYIHMSGRGVVERLSVEANLADEEMSSEEAGGLSLSAVSGRLSEMDVSSQHSLKGGAVWCLSKSKGVAIMIPDVGSAPTGDLEYGGLESPFKLVWSPQHEKFVVAGSRTVYILSQNGVIDTKCGFATHKLSDMDVSSSGEVAILSNSDSSSVGLLRVLDKGLWKLNGKMDFSGKAQLASFARAGKATVAVESTVDGTSSVLLVDYLNGSSTVMLSGIQGGVAALIYDDITQDTVVVMKNGDVSLVGEGLSRPLGKIASGVRFAKGMMKATVPATATQKKIRVYVGSWRGLNDRWDSGEIETTKTAILYGGGDNLVPGQEYWVTVMIWSEELGWSAPYERRFWVSRS
jgi:hypothetical protein